MKNIYDFIHKWKKKSYMVLVQYELLVMPVRNSYTFQWLHDAMSRWILNVL